MFGKLVYWEIFPAILHFHCAMDQCKSARSESRSGLKGLGFELYSDETPSSSRPSRVQQLAETKPSSSLSESSCWDRSSSSGETSHSSQSEGSLRFALMRSTRGMRGLEGAELGESMVELDPFTSGGGSGFRTGQKIGPTTVTPSLPLDRQRLPRNRSATVSGASLSRSGTLFSANASSSRKSAELKALLGGARRKVSSKMIIPPISSDGFDTNIEQRPESRHTKSASTTDLPGALSLEKAKARARVEIDIALESDTLVEGSCLRGKLIFTIRKASKSERPIWIGGGKLRIVGFEGKFLFFELIVHHLTIYQDFLIMTRGIHFSNLLSRCRQSLLQRTISSRPRQTRRGFVEPERANTPWDFR